MKRSLILAGLAAISLMSLGMRGRTEPMLPDGPNRDLVSRACSACHDLGMFSSTGRSREGWNATIEDMISFGMDVSPAERALILDYLTTYLPPPR